MRLHHWKRDRDEWWRLDGDEASTSEHLHSEEPTTVDGAAPTSEWHDLSEHDHVHAGPRNDIPLALMLMEGSTTWQRIDGMGMARQALEAPVTGNRWHDLTDGERLVLANGRAWCHVVHADLSPVGNHQDPVVLVDAIRHAEIAYAIGPDDPEVATTLSLIELRRGNVHEAVRLAERAVNTFARLSDGRRTGRAHGSATLAVVMLALASAHAGDTGTALALGSAARATRTALDVNEAALAALLQELSVVAGRQRLPSVAEA
jgi:hypothetical protein